MTCLSRNKSESRLVGNEFRVNPTSLTVSRQQLLTPRFLEIFGITEPIFNEIKNGQPKASDVYSKAFESKGVGGMMSIN
jgi:hypothetical protein